jgi:hypothetical protein
MKLFFRKLIGIICTPFSLGYGSCFRCKRTWNICKGHATYYSSGDGCFPLCEPCWKELKPFERIPYYKKLFGEWEKFQPVEFSKKELIIKAVREGK